MRSISQILGELPRTTLEGQGSNWLNLAVLGTAMRNEGIDFRAKGYEKLGDYLASLSEYEFYLDRNCDKPVKYVREKTPVSKVVGKKHETRSHNSPNFLSWAYIGRIPDALNELADLALSEEWSSNSERKFDILSSYLNYTFMKLMSEGKILYTDDSEYAAFNTGLVDKRYLPIFGLFRKNKLVERGQDWFLIGWTIRGEGKAGKTLNRLFTDVPERASYISNVTDVCYDSSCNMAISYDHIMVERINRLPLIFLEENGPADFDYLRFKSATEEEKDRLYDELREAIRNDIRSQNRIRHRLDDAISLAVSKTEWNYKTAVPSYNPKENVVNLLLPLSLMEDSHIDVALVLTKSPKSGNYQAETILTLQMAYKNARLIACPDSYWLTNKSASTGIEEVSE